jgi:CRP-like cAMP-binding protein
MIMQQFLAYLKQITPLSNDSCNDFIAKCKEYKYPKGFELVKAGQVCNYIYFIKSGIGKVFYSKEDKEIIDWIGDEGNIISSIISFLSRKPSIHIVKLLEPSELIGIHYDDLEVLYREHHDLERMGRLLTTHALIELQERINSMQFETARQRYDNFLLQHPNCINRISLGDLASYLSMTQVTLSRIRAQQ